MSIDYTRYVDPTVSEDDDNGTMPESVANLAAAVVGHRIVAVDGNRLRLDDGRTVVLVENSDCCAYTDIAGVVHNLSSIDHVITDVATSDGYTRWHILADAGQVLELQVGWSCGNPFYYSYGFTVEVESATGGAA